MFNMAVPLMKTLRERLTICDPASLRTAEEIRRRPDESGRPSGTACVEVT